MKPATLRSWFTWWFVLVFPMCPMDVYVHVLGFITIANIRMQLSQTIMPVFWDDGMFHTMLYLKQSSPWSESWFIFSPEVTTKDQCKSCWWFSKWLVFLVEKFHPRQRHSTQWWSNIPAGAYGREECRSTTFHRYFHSYSPCLSSTTLSRLSIKSSLIWLHSI